LSIALPTRWVQKYDAGVENEKLIHIYQAIALAEAQKPKNAGLVKESIELAKELYDRYASEATFEQFASEVMVNKYHPAYLARIVHSKNGN
jgi:hypothetical protein